MKFGVREVCDVVFRAKAPMKVGNRIFYKNEPVIYFDTLKTSTLEGAATTVYATGGKGNSRLLSWDGERTVTFTMEDALISPEGLSILTGAGLIEAGDNSKIVYVHSTETMAIGAEDDKDTSLAKATANTDGTVTFTSIPLSKTPSTASNAEIYVMLMDPNGQIISEPFITGKNNDHNGEGQVSGTTDLAIAKSNPIPALKVAAGESAIDLTGYMVLVDYYVEHKSNAMEINITPDKFGGAFYVEASTLFRDQATQQDLPAEFIIPNARVQSNFTFTMAGSGDPSTFTFTMDAFPDYTRFDKSEKVLASIQVIGMGSGKELIREATTTNRIEQDGLIVEKETNN